VEAKRESHGPGSPYQQEHSQKDQRRLSAEAGPVADTGASSGSSGTPAVPPLHAVSVHDVTAARRGAAGYNTWNFEQRRRFKEFP
jgi:hypothetical protein